MKNSVQSPLNFKKTTVTRLNPAGTGQSRNRRISGTSYTITSRGM